MNYKISISVLVLLLVITLTFIIIRNHYCQNKNNNANNHAIRHVAKNIGIKIYHGKEMYQRFHSNHNQKEYKDIEYKCLSIEAISNLFDEYKMNMNNIIKYSHGPNNTMMFKHNLENNLDLFGVISDQYQRCNTVKQNILDKWDTILNGWDDNELWYSTFIFNSYWNDDFLTNDYWARFDQKTVDWQRYWAEYLRLFAIDGTLETANMLDQLAEKNKAIPQKAADYRKCAQLIRDRINKKSDEAYIIQNQQIWSRWWETTGQK